MAYLGSVASAFAVQALAASGLALALALACQAGAAHADQPGQPDKPPQTEVWSGGEAFHRIWSLHGGASFAPFGGVREDGLRLRAAAGYSDYGDGTISFTDLLVGYHAQLGPLTLKVFGGVTAGDFRPEDPLSTPPGAALGGKAVVEAWWHVTDRVWTSADLSWGQTADATTWTWRRSVYTSRVRLGWRLWPELSAGLEGGAAGARLAEEATAGIGSPDVARVGGFVRYEWATGELSLSAGLAVEDPGGDRHAVPFGTLSLLTRF